MSDELHEMLELLSATKNNDTVYIVLAGVLPVSQPEPIVSNTRNSCGSMVLDVVEGRSPNRRSVDDVVRVKVDSDPERRAEGAERGGIGVGGGVV